MPYKAKEKAWLFFVLSIIAFWFKGGLIFIGLLWTMFFLIELPHETKELKRYNRYISQKDKLNTNGSNNIFKEQRNSISQEKEQYSKMGKEIDQRNVEIDEALRKIVSDMNI